MSKKEKTVTLLYGLPGSGKSTYAKTVADDKAYMPKAASIDMDSIAKYIRKEYSSSNIPLKIANHLAQDAVMKLHHREHIIIDGLVTSNDSARRIFEAIKKEGEKEFKINFEIVWWTPDREACAHNDQGRRRGTDSLNTIANLPFEEPSPQLIQEFNVWVQRKEVVKKPQHKVWAVNNNLGDVDFLESDTWSLGGTWRSGDGTTGTSSPGDLPTSFTEFDKLLEEVCPLITFLQYKKVYAATVTVKQTSQSDYYGSETNYANYVCDLKKLYSMLIESGLVKE